MNLKDSRPGILLVITGPTASGKDTVVGKIMMQFSTFKKLVTTTTRLPREGEKEGINHFFLERPIFEEKARNGEFLETNEYSNNLYGTTKREINKVLEGENLIWRIDPSAAAKVEEIIKSGFPTDLASMLLKRTIVVYLKPENEEVLVSRLQKRGFTIEEIDKRLTEEKRLWNMYRYRFSNVIVNHEGELSTTVSEVAKLITSI